MKFAVSRISRKSSSQARYPSEPLQRNCELSSSSKTSAPLKAAHCLIYPTLPISLTVTRWLSSMKNTLSLAAWIISCIWFTPWLPYSPDFSFSR